jgi:4-diphosphocytidyl-2C-methyl-D-erythritol kinase
VTPLRGIVGDPPGILLLTPGLAVPTPAVFAAYAAGAGAGRGGAARVSSAHLAEELRAGLAARALVDRAGVLAVANDLLPAAAAVVPELPAVRRALVRRLGRPVGLSGSGPTLWVLYPSLGEAEAAAADLRAAVATGELVLPGDEPFIGATTITSQPRDRSVP